MEKAKILIVDDIQKNIVALSELIRSPDIEVVSTTNAHNALEVITENDFCLALIDVQMPDIDGFELARLIRGVNQFKSLPIIFVTASARTEDFILEGYETGAMDVLFKPLQPQIVRSKVRTFVELYQQRQLLKKHVNELEKLRLQADAANLAKSQFLANMSHEIRTPLAAVMGFSEMISRGVLSEKEKIECTQAVKRNGSLLLRLIDDILDFSKVEAEKLEFEEIEFALSEIFKDVNSNLSFRANEKGISLVWKVDGIHESDIFIGDPTRLKQMLLNIIGNAIKFTEKGQVEVRCSLIPSKNTGALKAISVVVKDQGVGLAPEDSARLFQPFTQADPSMKRRFGGSGLGLVISKRIANRMQGDIRLVTSTPGVGSTFEITFKLPTGQSKPVGSEVSSQEITENFIPDFSSLRILAVDDAPDNLTLLNLYLRPTKAQITTARNGLEAVEMVQKQKFDIIVMDVQMPVMDGHAATQKIRRLGYKGPIIALTAHALASEHEKCIQAGCSEVLSKPVLRESLIHSIRSLTQSQQKAVASLN